MDHKFVFFTIMSCLSLNNMNTCYVIQNTAINSNEFKCVEQWKNTLCFHNTAEHIAILVPLYYRRKDYVSHP